MRRDPSSDAERVAETYAGYGRSSRRARAWSATNPGNVAIREELAAAALGRIGEALASGGPVLDVGCGTGWWLRRLADHGVDPHRLSGVDVLTERVDAARGAVPGSSVAVADARDLPHEPESFVAVTLFTVLSSLGGAAQVVAALREAARVLAPGGALLVYEPRVPTPNRATRLVRDRDLDAAGIEPRTETSLTLLPALSRRLGRTAPVAYPALARMPFLRTHRLVCWLRAS